MTFENDSVNKIIDDIGVKIVNFVTYKNLTVLYCNILELTWTPLMQKHRTVHVLNIKDGI
jgi:hypothetical protein